MRKDVGLDRKKMIEKKVDIIQEEGTDYNENLY